MQYFTILFGESRRRRTARIDPWQYSQFHVADARTSQLGIFISDFLHIFPKGISIFEEGRVNLQGYLQSDFIA